MRLFLVPALLVSGGISGAAQIISYYTNWPIGLMVFIGNVPRSSWAGGIWAARACPAHGRPSLPSPVHRPAGAVHPEQVTGDMVLNTIYGGLLLASAWAWSTAVGHQRRFGHPGTSSPGLAFPYPRLPDHRRRRGAGQRLLLTSVALTAWWSFTSRAGGRGCLKAPACSAPPSS